MVSECQAEPGIRRAVSVLGWYGKNNWGDEAFKYAFHDLFPDLYFHFVRDKPSEHLPLILGGGDVIKSSYLKEIKQPFVAVGVGLGYPSEMDLLLKSPCKAAWFRNMEDVRLSQTNEFQYCPDLAFAIKAPNVFGSPPSARKKVAVILANSVINPKIGTRQFGEWSYQQYLYWELAQALDAMGEWYDIHFLPMSQARFAYDEASHFEVASRMKNEKPVVLWNWSDLEGPLEFMSLLGTFDLVISMKFHGLVFSTIMGVPFVNIGLTRKTDLYCQQDAFAGLGLSIEPYSFTAERLLEKINNAEKKDIRGRLRGYAQKQFNFWHDDLAPQIRSALFSE